MYCIGCLKANLVLESGNIYRINKNGSDFDDDFVRTRYMPLVIVVLYKNEKKTFDENKCRLNY